MALSLKDSQRMLDASKAAGKVCMVTHTRRFSSPHREIRKRIKEGTFHLHHMVVETYFFRRTNLNMHGQPRSWVDNLLWHHGCHSVDLAHWILDEPNWDVWGQKGPDHATLKIPMDKIYTNVERYGNTSAGSVPIALAEAADEGRIKPGDKVLLVGFGAGMSWGALTLEWTAPVAATRLQQPALAGVKA